MDDLDQIRQKIDIVTLISEYIPVKKAGRNFKALCPFHNEKTPSFVISPERQIWHCFGACQIGGDIFSFVQKYENLEFPEVLRILAKRAGVTLKDYQPTETSRLKDRLYEINHLASEFYHYLLTKHSLGQKALAYALSRGLTEKSLKTFSLGYAPDSWESLIKYLAGKKRYHLSDLNQAGLVVSGKGGSFYDRFRGRLMFTLKDHRGNVVGFAGRVLPGSEEKQKGGKYINSPETPVYIKSNVLYGLEVTKESIKKEKKAIIVEGEIDAILSFQEGVSNVVAIKGSALTEGQVNLLKRYTDNLILALDMDLAGDSASRRGIEIAENAGMDLKVAKLPLGKDPAECITKSPSLYKKAIDQPVSVFDFFLQSALGRFDKSTVEGKRKIAAEFLNSLVRINNEIIKGHYLKKLSSVLDLSLDSVSEELQRVGKKTVIRKSDQNMQAKVVREREEVVEEYLLAIFLQTKRPKILEKAVFENLSPEDFKTLVIGKIFKIYLDFVENNKEFEIQAFVKLLPAELVQTVDILYLSDLGPLAKDQELEEKEAKNTAFEIKKLSLKRKINDLSLKIKENEKSEETVGNLDKKIKEYAQELSRMS